MSNLPLQPLVWDWTNAKDKETNAVCRAKSPSHEYIVRMNVGGEVYVDYYKFDNGEGENNRKDEPPVFDSVSAAQEWAQSTHYASKMRPYVKPDSITDIANWFRSAKPEPTIEDLCVQIGCMLEEVCEFFQGLNFAPATYAQLSEVSDLYKSKHPWALDRLEDISYDKRIEIVDACCDINVTSVGVMQLLGGVDVLGAQREVIRSNNSKMVNGKFEFDENGKIMKAEGYSKPDLTPFVK